MRVSRSLATVGAAALVTVGAIASPAAADDGASGFTIDDNYVGRYAPSQNVAVSGVGCNPVGNSRSAITWGLYSQDGTAIEDAAGAEAANSDGTWSATIDIPSIVAKNGFDNPAVLTLGVACVDYNGQVTGTQQMPLILDSTDVDGDAHISSWDTDGDGTFDSQTFTANLTGFTPGESVNFYITDEDGNTKDNPRAAEIRTELTKLAKDAEQLAPYHATAGRVITPAAASSAEVSPSKFRLILITTVVGLFAGLVLVLIRETRSRSLASPTQLADLTALPVWSAEEGAPEPWLAPTRMLAMAIDRDHWVDLIVDASDPQARDLHRVLSASLAETRVPAPRLIDINQPLASLLDEVRPSRHVLVAVRKGHDLKALHALLDELAIINREVNGLIYLGDQVAAPASAPTTPAQSAEVIEPEAEEEATEETSSEKGKK